MKNRLVTRLWPGMALALAGLGCGENTGPNPGATPGATIIAVSITTSGLRPDANGYMLVLGNGLPTRVSANGTRSFKVSPGPYTLQLTEVAANCTPAVNPVTVTATEGETVRTSLHVDCRLVGGDLDIIVETAGPVPDSNGYLLTIPVFLGSITRRVGANDSVRLGSLFPGIYYITIGDIAPHCSIVPTVRAGTVVPGGVARVLFTANCSDPAATGVLRLLVTTSGPADVEGYTVSIDSGPPVPVGLNDSLILSLPQGAHSLQFLGTSSLCVATSGGSYRTVTITPGLTTTLTTRVVCGNATQGRVRFIGTTTGPNAPNLLIGILSLNFQLVDIVDLSPNGASLSHSHPPGTYSVGVGKPALCTGGSQVSRVTIVAGSVTDVHFTVNCP